jgi:hypothetical protein
VLNVKNVVPLLHTQGYNTARLISVIKYIITNAFLTVSFLPANYWRTGPHFITQERFSQNSNYIQYLTTSLFSSNQLHKTCPSEGHEIRHLLRNANSLLPWSKQYATSPKLTDTWIYSSFFKIKFSERQKIRRSQLFQFLRASCCFRSSKYEHSHQHSDIQRLHLHSCLNVLLELLNRTVSIIP